MMIYIDPSYKAYYGNRLFDKDDKILNRDDTLAPFIRMREALQAHNKTVKTADYLYSSHDPLIEGAYYSFGLLDNLDNLLLKKNIKLKAFVVFEPPVVAPELYRALPKLTEAFEHVYVHNVVGDGYSLNGVLTHKLKKLYWPQPHCDVISHFWDKDNRQKRVVVINGNHKPRSVVSELYSKRIEVMAQLAEFDGVDLYGRGWEKWNSRASMWLPYWRNRRVLMSIYQGSCESKLEVLSQYDFCLCFENMRMQGYITEKLFDCLYAGTVPIYLGATDISELVPDNVYIDFRQYDSIPSLYQRLKTMTRDEVNQYKCAGRGFLQSQRGAKYYHSINEMIEF